MWTARITYASRGEHTRPRVALAARSLVQGDRAPEDAAPGIRALHWPTGLLAGIKIAPLDAAGSAQTSLPRPEPTFTGTAERTRAGETPPLRPRAGAPNVVIVLIDDAVFGNAATLGGPVATPALDPLAAEGVRYNRSHVTALYSPMSTAATPATTRRGRGAGAAAP